MTTESQLELIDKQFKKKYGGNYRGLGSEEVYEPIPRVPLICPSLNKILGNGMPVGRIIEIFGQPSHGKTSIAFHIIKSFQKHNPNRLALFIDAEHALDPEYAEKCGVNMDNFCILAPDNAQEALDGIRSGISLVNEQEEDKAEQPESVFSLIVLDSVAGLVPSDEYTKDVGGGMIGALARLMSSVVKQLISLAAKYNTTIIFINQERSCNMTGYGPKTTTTGGVALQYYCSLRLDVTRTGWNEDKKGNKTGIQIKVETVKNKTATPMKQAHLEINYPHEIDGKEYSGLDVEADIINVGIQQEIIKKGGSWFTYKDFKAQGMEKFKAHLLQTPEFYQELYSEVMETFN